MAISDQEFVDNIFHRLHEELYNGCLKGKIFSCKNEPAIVIEGFEDQFSYYIKAKNSLNIELSYNTSSMIFNCSIFKNTCNELMKLPGELSFTLDEYLNIKDLHSSDIFYYMNDNNRKLNILSTKEIDFHRWTKNKLNILAEIVKSTYDAMKSYEIELFDNKNRLEKSLPSMIEEYIAGIMGILNSDINISEMLYLDNSNNIRFTKSGFFHEIQFKSHGKKLYLEWNIAGWWDISILHDRFNLTQKVFKNLINPLLEDAQDLNLRMEGEKSDGIFLLGYKYIEFDKNDFSIRKPEYLSAMIIRLIIMVIKSEQLVEQYLLDTENDDNVLSSIKKWITNPIGDEKSAKNSQQELKNEIDEKDDVHLNNPMSGGLSSICQNILSGMLSPIEKLKGLMAGDKAAVDGELQGKSQTASNEVCGKSLENRDMSLAPEFRQSLEQICNDILIGLSHAEIFKKVLNLNTKLQKKTGLNELAYHSNLSGSIEQIRISYANNSSILKIGFIAPFDVDFLDECENCCRKMAQDQTQFEINEDDGEFSFYYEITLNPEEAAAFETEKTVHELIKIYAQMRETSNTLKSYY